jgi:hypothetical protein
MMIMSCCPLMMMSALPVLVPVLVPAGTSTGTSTSWYYPVLVLDLNHESHKSKEVTTDTEK